MTLADIRETFLRFFQSKGHTQVRSSSLVPVNDPSLLFTNSGMVQFKDVFLGVDQRPFTRAMSVQRCLRAGGKHNDLENVGYTARHHTFFEMLGNWSFGDYFKRESLMWGWELLTKVYGLPAERLWVTVYHTDDEAYDIWAKDIALPPERILRIGDNKGAPFASDNFWQMADTGPCGPSSEIFYDHGPSVPGGLPGSPEAEGDRYIEIWNHVFMQFDRQIDSATGKAVLTPLPRPCVDTGMGLERLAAVLQHVHSNYEIDLFGRLIQAAARETQVATGDLENPSLRVIADHLRACAFLIVDGVVPSNEGRGYVLRRIIRRACRHGHKLGQTQPFFYKLINDLIEEMGSVYPELVDAAGRVARVLHQEEQRFGETLENGMKMLEAALQKAPTTLSGDTAFTLYDTFGFPLDLTADICRERNVILDTHGFDFAMEKQKATARASGKFTSHKAVSRIESSIQDKSDFIGYEVEKSEASVRDLFIDGERVSKVSQSDHGEIIVLLDKTPFYAESGGQVGDVGVLTSDHGPCEFEVLDTQKLKPNLIGHYGRVRQGELVVGDRVTTQVDSRVRAHIKRHHSATHLMHKALRDVLGPHVVQKGSLVDAEKTRFDFAHSSPLTADELRRIEQHVNAVILKNEATITKMMPFDAALSAGAMALFGEKYEDEVRVLSIGDSCELCGGTHVQRTGDIGLFKIVSETGVAAGVRRIEAVAGEAALSVIQAMSQRMIDAANALKTSPDTLPQRTLQVLEQTKTQEKDIATLKSKLAAFQGEALVGRAIPIKNTHLLTAIVDSGDRQTLRDILDQLKNKLKTAVIVLATVEADQHQVHLIAGVTPDVLGKVKAGDLVNFVAQQVGGKGGGRADMAQAGGTDPKGLPAALETVLAWANDRL